MDHAWASEAWRRRSVRRLAPMFGLVAALTAAACASGSSTSSSATVTISLSEDKVSAPSTTMAPGRYRFAISNGGALLHEFLVFRSDLAPSAYPRTTAGDILENGPGIHMVSDGDNISPGRSQTRIVDLRTPGTYLLVCNLPDHFRLGMYLAVTVQ